MLRVIVRRSRDATYLTQDPAHELDGVRAGGSQWWLRSGAGHDVSDVFSSTSRSDVVGYDLVVAAPRPLSILLALDERHASEVVAAHRASVAATVDYLEQRALVVRDRRGGGDRDLPAQWGGIVSFTHGLNRHGEPHLHDHVLVGARPDGATSVLDARALFAHVPAADALYRSSLRHEVGERTPWKPWRSFRGVEMVAGLDEGYRALWGGHHAERGEKLHWTRRETLDRWRHDMERFETAGALRAPPVRSTLDEHAFAGALEGVFAPTRRDLVAAWANAAVYGQSARELSRSIDDLYPRLATSRGVREPGLGLGEARMTAQVRERGPRPLVRDELSRWTQRSREREASRSDRSR
ncbi:MAG TPA: relaxase domain-containing protein [Acidimicrobiales bacterium]|nr:relaxase domain-containing protein [Acidimicrobiales bacterium]